METSDYTEVVIGARGEETQDLVVRRSKKHLNRMPLPEAIVILESLAVGLNDQELWVGFNQAERAWDLGVKGTRKRGK